MIRPVVALLLTLLPVSLLAQDLTNFEKVLVPVLNQDNVITGANGSTFATSFGILPLQLKPITYFPANVDGAPAIGQSMREIFRVPLWSAPVIAKGRFVYVQRDDADRPMFATVTAIAADGERSDTPLPVVRERDALRGLSAFGVLPNHAMHIPPPPGTNWPAFIGYAQRHTLRVYDFTGSGTLVVAVRQRWTTWLSQDVISAIELPVNRRDFDHPTYPFYAEIDLGSSLDRWCYPALHARCSSFDAIVEVEPLTPGARYYAFVSTTDNVTQHVAIHLPR